ncbi:hypothetical protein BDN72DRAFT_965190 [Pluteus cervinus]|uniref:Uncharacterized protein n=1 Tax=Pluteus cervinus TaxID=181527 RepID=A0ACD3A749_9AGAR|nr:hypothetical protein BDN72DRAFT_965190 [Pluteus cervinus]
MAFYTDELECRVGYTNEIFSPEQTNEIKRRVTEAVIELEELELNILLYEGQTLIPSSSSVSGYLSSTGSCVPRTNRDSDAFAVQSRLLLDRIRRYGIALAPVKSLPAEILSQILLFTASGHPFTLPFSGRDPRIAWSRVCAFWRTTTLGHPVLWNDLVLSSSRFGHGEPGPRRDDFASWVSRSGSSPFSLRIEPAFSAQNTSSLLRTPPVLTAFSTRLKKLQVHLSVSQFEALCTLPMNSFERLDEVSLSIMSTEFQQPSDIPMTFNFLALEAITIVGNVTLTISSLPWAQLRKVDFREMEAAGGFCLDILGRMPNLEECTLDSVCMCKPYRSMTASGVIRFTKLKKLWLTFEGGCGMFSFFERWDWTNLEGVSFGTTSMIPSEPQPTAKRKAMDESNPLLHAAKKAKKDGKSAASNKRKLLGAEEQPGGLLIVRGASSSSQPPQAASSQPAPSTERYPSQPLPQTHHSRSKTPSLYPNPQAGPSKPPSKKFRADSQPPPSSSSTRPQPKPKLKPPPVQEREPSASSYPREDQDIERDVRAMADEADHLRRASQMHTAGMDGSGTLDPRFQFPLASSDQSGESNGNRHSRTKSSKKGKDRVIDVQVPLPEHDTPQAVRNKMLREGAMKAIANGWKEDDSQQRGRSAEPGKGQHQRKRSISSRGKRISTSFENSGVIAHPHSSVSETSFYKHIDPDLPESERIRQLLIWCSSRAATQLRQQASAPPSAETPPLPPLSEKAAAALKTIEDDTLRLLAEKKIDLSQFDPSAGGPQQRNGDVPWAVNEINVRNQSLAIIYGAQLQRAEAEATAWRGVTAAYDSYSKRLKNALDKRSGELKEFSARLEKAKARPRNPGEPILDPELEKSCMPADDQIPLELRDGWALVKSQLGHRLSGDERPVGSSGQQKGYQLGLRNDELDAEITRRLPEVEEGIDKLQIYANSAKKTVRTVERFLDQRFAALSLNLMTRSNPPLPAPPLPAPDSGSASSTAAPVLATYIKSGVGSSGNGGGGSSTGAGASALGNDAQTLLRALSRVDTIRPPAKIGDAARRAVREVQRAGESGVAAVGEKKFTYTMAAGSSTPRKTPATPRRGGTPGRDREKDRERDR